MRVVLFVSSHIRGRTNDLVADVFQYIHQPCEP